MHPALAVLDGLPRVVPDIWKKHEQLRAAFQAQRPWPAWCYAPTAIALALVNGRLALATKVAALAAWRQTKTVLRFDPTLRQALADTPLDAAVPVDVLRRMPGWCVYLELDGLSTHRGPAHGAWCFMEPGGQIDPGPVFLSVLLNTAHAPETLGDDHAMLCLSIKLQGESLLESVRSTYPGTDDLHRQLANALRPVLSMLLYICSAGAELSQDGAPGWPAPAAPVRTRREGVRYFPAQKLAMWDVGLRLGSALRASHTAVQRPGRGDSGTGRAVPVAHVRGAHWHTFVLGSHRVDLAHRPREVRWMPPIPVGVEGLAEVPAVVRPVR